MNMIPSGNTDTIAPLPDHTLPDLKLDRRLLLIGCQRQQHLGLVLGGNAKDLSCGIVTAAMKVTTDAYTGTLVSARWRALPQRRCSVFHCAGRRHDSALGSCRLSLMNSATSSVSAHLSSNRSQPMTAGCTSSVQSRG
jgi:hypothetical protein